MKLPINQIIQADCLKEMSKEAIPPGTEVTIKAGDFAGRKATVMSECRRNLLGWFSVEIYGERYWEFVKRENLESQNGSK